VRPDNRHKTIPQGNRSQGRATHLSLAAFDELHMNEMWAGTGHTTAQPGAQVLTANQHSGGCITACLGNFGKMHGPGDRWLPACRIISCIIQHHMYQSSWSIMPN